MAGPCSLALATGASVGTSTAGGTARSLFYPTSLLKYFLLHLLTKVGQDYTMI